MCDSAVSAGVQNKAMIEIVAVIFTLGTKLGMGQITEQFLVGFLVWSLERSLLSLPVNSGTCGWSHLMAASSKIKLEGWSSNSGVGKIITLTLWLISAKAGTLTFFYLPPSPPQYIAWL